MSLIKTEKEIAIMREGGKRLANIMAEVASRVAPGIVSMELDQLSKRLIEEDGDKPAFLGYRPEGAIMPYPATLCVSINDEMVHGIPSKEKIFKEGDIVSLDLGLIHEGLVADMNVTVVAGKTDKTGERLITIAREALEIGIRQAVPGMKTGTIGAAIETFIRKNKFDVSHELGGHGVGKRVHEQPHIAHFGKKTKGIIMRPGMVFTIEPTITEGSAEMYVGRDGYTCKTADGKRAAQFEHMLVITEEGNEVLTRL